MGNIRLPGVVDIHVHLRDPGATHKEDFFTACRAAIAGGVVFMIDMPNNPFPTVTPSRLAEKIEKSAKHCSIPIGFHYGTDGKNCATFSHAWKNKHVFGLKIYCNQTTGTLLVDDPKILSRVFHFWNSEKPILVHAVGDQLEQVIFLSKKTNRRVHICHVHAQDAVSNIRKAKKTNSRISAGVTPHHLFLTSEDEKHLGAFARMLPPLGRKKDQDALWGALFDGTIDLIESDHAPHTHEEKMSDNPPYGVPGLETTLGLLLKNVYEKKISLEQVIRWTHEAPCRLFFLSIPKNTYIELDPDTPYSIGANGYKTKCNWSSFDGWTAYGKVERVVIRGTHVVE